METIAGFTRARVAERDQHGDAILMIGNHEDITERKRTAAALAESEEQFRTIVSSVSEGMVLQESSGRVLTWNKTAERIFGIPAENIVGMLASEQRWKNIREDGTAFPTEEHPSHRTLQTGQSCHDVIMGVRHAVSNELSWISLNTNPVYKKGSAKPTAVAISFTDITARKEAEDALRTSRMHLSNAIRLAKLGYWEYDFLKDVFTFNDDFYAIFHTTAEREGGYLMPSAQYAKRFGHPDDMARVGEEIGKAATTTDPNYCTRIEHRIIYADGGVGHIAVQFRILKDEQGRTVKSFGMNQDITEIKQAEVALRDSEKHYRQLFNSMITGFALHKIILDENGKPCDYRFLEANPAFETLTGLKAPDIIGRTALEVLPGLEPLWFKSYGHVAMTGETVHFESYSRELAKHYEVTSYSPERGYFATIFQDVTERKQAEEALRQRGEQLRILFDNLTIGIYRTTPDGQILTANPALVKILGYESLDELVSRNLEGEGFHPSYPRSYFKSLIEENGEIQGLESAWVRHDGSTIFVRENARGVRGEHGEMLYYEGTVEDITEHKQAEEQSKEQAQEIERSRNILLQILESIPARVFWKDKDLRYLGCNSLFAHDAGRPRPDDLLGKTDYEMGWRDQADLYRADDQEVMQSAQPKLGIIEPQTTPTGEKIWLRTSKVPLKESDGVVWGMLGVYEDITKERHRDEALRASEERFKQVAESAGEWIWEVDAEGLYIYSSPVVQRILGYSPEELVGKLHFYDLFSPDKREELKAAALAAFAQRIAFMGFVNSTLHKNGNVVILETSGVPVLDEEGNLLGYRGTDTDITERRQAEEALHRHNEYLTALQETTLELLAEHDLDRLLESIIRRAGELMGTTTGWLDLLEPDANHLTPKIALGALATESLRFSAKKGEGLSGKVWESGRPIAVEDYDVWPGRIQGHQSNLIRSIVALPLLSGSKTLGVLGLAYEKEVKRTFDETAISLLHQFARLATLAIENARLFSVANRELAERRQAEVALRESENRYRFLAENATDFIWVMDMNLKGTFCSPSVTRMRGYSVEEANAQSLEETLTPASLEIARQVLGEELALGRCGPEGKVRVRTLELEMVRKDGSTLWTETNASIIWDSDGNPIGILGSTRDISERKRAEQEREQLETQLRRAQKMEAIGTLAGGIAHDFNNILTPIMAYTEMAVEALPSDTSTRTDLEHVIDAANRAKDLVRQILTFSRQTEQARFAMSLTPIIKETLKLIRASLPSTIVIHEYVAPHTGEVMADPSQMHQVLMNLCTNAAASMRQGGGELSIRLEDIFITEDFARAHPHLHEGPYVRLSVSDTGCGMDAETLTRAFEPFFTTKPVGEGTGLGLSVVHGIITGSGGDVHVTSEPGTGTRFDIYLPRAMQPAPAAPAEKAEIRPGHERILIVDDEPEIARVGQRVLEKYGYHVTIRTSSVEALEVFKANPDRFDMVITDLTMPHITGLQLTEEIRALQPDLPVILITGFSNQMDEQTIQSLQINASLLKPLSPSELARIVRLVLDQRADAAQR
ncbi:MAG: PAS domain S-box protein [bacterium]|nr:PAS domain S-box protein [bacterium]